MEGWRDYPGLSGWVLNATTCFFMREAEGENTKKRRRQWDHGARDGSDAAPGQGVEATGSWER